MGNKKDQLIGRTLKLYVAAVSDGADEIGIGRVCMDSGISPITKKKRMAGFARPGKLVRSSVHRPYDETELDAFMSLVTKGQANDLIILDMAGATDCSGWGQVLTRISIPLKIRGAVVDGTIRDVVDIDEMGFVVFARGRHPGTMRGRMDMESIGEPIVCGGVTIHPGDLIFGDGDGVAVIPQDRIDDVLTAAEEVVSTDEWWAAKLKKGEDPHELHKEKPIP